MWAGFILYPVIENHHNCEASLFCASVSHRRLINPAIDDGFVVLS